MQSICVGKCNVRFLYMTIILITMDLFVKSAIAVVAVVAVFGVAYFLVSSGVFSQQITQSQAVALVYHDLQNSNPNAQINITNVSQSQYAGSWHILASVILNATSPCPSYSIYSFDYPKYGFVYQIENIYTNNCIIYGNSGVQTNIGSASAAITQSYDLHIPAVETYINEYGYSSMVVYATYYKNIGYGEKNYSNMWRVNYTSPKANTTVSVLISQINGTSVS